jgi:hypothetical protein
MVFICVCVCLCVCFGRILLQGANVRCIDF